ncbi:OsmC family peroxiredoxin [Streptomyces sp. ISID311]|uniref:OsmC family peroxiredoxin n=1 Tax=Streptomyces sp. ISID311 TaxID=2601673 RepID=UPI0011BD3A1E|nr:OsmC family peroxiredoxin [Streptomyces sp. ISID311]TXC99906.1 OsmC family peroxiredoxin [Streptomyces sp. ISID311]
MAIRVRRRAEARWAGTVPTGKGHIRTASGALDSDYSLRSREADDAEFNTNPEELIGAGLAGCFAMSVANLLNVDGYADVGVTAKAMVQLEQTDAGFRITEITLSVTGSAAGLTDDEFALIADEAKRTCPVSLALAGTTITLSEKRVVG